MERITDKLVQEIVEAMRLALTDEIDAGEAVQRIRYAQRIAQAKRLGVPVTNYQTSDLDRMARMLGLKL